MGGHDKQQQVQQQPLADGDQDAERAREESTKSLDFVIAFSTGGKGKQTDLPRHVAQAAARWGDQIKTLMPDIAKHAKGDIVFEVAALLGMPAADRVQHALKAKSPISADELRAQMRVLSVDDLATIGEKAGLVGELRKVLKGPMGKELPELARLS